MTWRKRSRAWSAPPSSLPISTSRLSTRPACRPWWRAARLSQACGLPVITDMSAVIEAMRAMKLRTLAMATPFRPFINERLVKYLASEQITVNHDNALGIERNTEIRRLPIPVEYNLARKTYLECETRPDGI